MTTITETNAAEDTEWPQEVKSLLVVDEVTFADGSSYFCAHDEHFIAIARNFPELRSDVEDMFRRAGSKLKTMRYPSDLYDLRETMGPEDVGLVRTVLAKLPCEKDQMEQLDLAVKAAVAANRLHDSELVQEVAEGID